jgi:hypothetical protein
MRSPRSHTAIYEAILQTDRKGDGGKKRLFPSENRFLFLSFSVNPIHIPLRKYATMIHAILISKNAPAVGSLRARIECCPA